MLSRAALPLIGEIIPDTVASFCARSAYQLYLQRKFELLQECSESMGECLPCFTVGPTSCDAGVAS